MIKHIHNKYQEFLATIIGKLVSALCVWGVGFLLLLIAVKSGSLLEWVLVIIALIMGINYLVQAVKQAVGTKSTR